MADETAMKRRGRPRKTESAAKMTVQLCVLMPPEMKEWALDNGGSEMVRSLIANEKQHQEALRWLLAEREDAKKSVRILWRDETSSFGPNENEEEGRLIWGGPLGAESALITLTTLDGRSFRLRLADILRVQRLEGDRAILWER